jgi:predicted pyridoxine 5'-phosphate oxidase superfamily flavin-nucleotide-binding protein
MVKNIEEISEPAANIIKQRNFAFLATLSKDGSPQVTPIWIDIDDTTILVNTAEGRIKQKTFLEIQGYLFH